MDCTLEDWSDVVRMPWNSLYRLRLEHQLSVAGTRRLAAAQQGMQPTI